MALICEVRRLGRVEYSTALGIQQRLAELRKQGRIPDQLLLLEHPHVITLGRNASRENLLASPDQLAKRGVQVFETNRGGDVTYHGPGQLVGYPILDLKEWKRDVVAYLRSLEQVMIDTLASFGISGHRDSAGTGVWTRPLSSESGSAGESAKIAAIGVHLSRWVTTHGFALNVATDLDYFRLIVPCGLTKPVTSMGELKVCADPSEVADRLIYQFGRIFEREMLGHDSSQETTLNSEPGAFRPETQWERAL